MTERVKSLGRLAPVILVILILPLLLVRLDSWPAPWFDEGIFLQTAKNIAQYGRYVLQRDGGSRDLDPALSTGPTVLMPASLMFRAFGIGLAQGRIVSVLYALGAILFCLGLARQMMDERAAVIATALMVLSPWGDFVQMGRFAMGEMASLTFVLAGLYLLVRSADRHSIAFPIGAGLSFSLAILSKPQNVLILGVLLLISLADIMYYKRLRFKRWGIPFILSLSVFLVWQGLQFAFSGTSGSATSSFQTHGLATLVRPSQVLANFNTLAKSGYLLWTLPAIVYLGLDILRKRKEGSKDFCFLAVICAWMLWFVLGSIGWVRYAFIPISISGLALTKLFDEATNGFRLDHRQVSQVLRQNAVSPVLAQFALALMPILLIGYGMLVTVDGIINESDRSAQQMATYIDRHVPREELVETWEYEVAFLSSTRDLHLPGLDVLETVTRRDRLGVATEGSVYSPEPLHPSYLVDGPMSKWTHFYDEYIEQHCALVTTIGSYDLYACTK